MVKKPYKTDMRTFESKDGKTTYLVLRMHGQRGAHSYHVFREVVAKTAARRCGAKLPKGGNTVQHWDSLWN